VDCGTASTWEAASADSLLARELFGVERDPRLLEGHQRCYLDDLLELGD